MIGTDAELGQDLLDEGPDRCGVHRDRIACLVFDPGAGEVHLVVADLLVGCRRVEPPVDGPAGLSNG